MEVCLTFYAEMTNPNEYTMMQSDAMPIVSALNISCLEIANLPKFNHHKTGNRHVETQITALADGNCTMKSRIISLFILLMPLLGLALLHAVNFNGIDAAEDKERNDIRALRLQLSE